MLVQHIRDGRILAEIHADVDGSGLSWDEKLVAQLDPTNTNGWLPTDRLVIHHGDHAPTVLTGDFPLTPLED